MKGGEVMDKVAVVISILGLVISLVFSCLAFKRNDRQDAKSEGKTQGSIFSDIGYIKACVDRMEKNLTKVDERYKDVLQRLSKVEEVVTQVTKRLDTKT